MKGGFNGGLVQEFIIQVSVDGGLSWTEKLRFWENNTDCQMSHITSIYQDLNQTHTQLECYQKIPLISLGSLYMLPSSLKKHVSDGILDSSIQYSP